MGYVDTYWLECDTAEAYDNSGCYDLELARARSVAMIRKRFLPVLMAGVTDTAVWQAGINGGNVFIMPYVSGSFDPGEPIALKGYGRRLATRGPRTQVLTFTDPAYVLNYAFYNRLHRHTDYVIAFRTSSKLHIADAPADMWARNVVAEDLDETVAWEAKCTWRSTDLPTIVDIGPLAPLFHAIPSQSTTIYFASGYYVTLKARLIDRFEVGAIGSPMAAGDDTYHNDLLIGKKVLVLASGLALPVDDGAGTVDWSSSIVRHVEKADGSPNIHFVGAPPAGEIIEVYELT